MNLGDLKKTTIPRSTYEKLLELDYKSQVAVLYKAWEKTIKENRSFDERGVAWTYYVAAREKALNQLTIQDEEMAISA